MLKKWKKAGYILLTMSLTSFFGCGGGGGHKAVVVPRSNGSKQEQIQYHMKEIERFTLHKKQEEKSFQSALSKQEMDKAREAENRRMQYQKKINKHILQLKQLRESDEAF